ncbi:MAG TPA: hypothetical protein VGR64_00035 [Terracidiphilus sp.]|nr:hypothetical protein [Terracidiphilus sp.]
MHLPANFLRMRTALLGAIACAASLLFAQPPAQSRLVTDLDNMVRSRFERVLGISNLEHYSVFRGQDETHPVAQMTVRVIYRKGVGKRYTILSQSGSALILHFGLKALLKGEEAINDPAAVSQSWITSDNYAMIPDPARTQTLQGRLCVALSIRPYHRAPNMVVGTVWVDPTDSAILRVEGVASKSPSIFAGTTHMMRDYSVIDGFAQATHARAESTGLFGHTVVVIDYSDYQIQLAPAR